MQKPLIFFTSRDKAYIKMEEQSVINFDGRRYNDVKAILRTRSPSGLYPVIKSINWICPCSRHKLIDSVIVEYVSLTPEQYDFAVSIDHHSVICCSDDAAENIRRFYNSCVLRENYSLSITKNELNISKLFNEQSPDEYTFKLEFDGYSGKSAPCVMKDQ